MNALQEKYGPQYARLKHPHKPWCHLQFVGFPCNQFAYQEPAANKEEFENGLYYVRPGKGFAPNFPISSKLKVNGDGEDPLFTFLKSRCPAPGWTIARNLNSITWEPVLSHDIRWNFHKFIVDHTGQPYMRFTSHMEPNETEHAIIDLINKCVLDDTFQPKHFNSSAPQAWPSVSPLGLEGDKEKVEALQKQRDEKFTSGEKFKPTDTVPEYNKWASVLRPPSKN